MEETTAQPIQKNEEIQTPVTPVEKTQPSVAFMPQRTLVLILVLALVVVGLFVVTLIPSAKKLTVTTKPHALAPLTYAQTTLKLSPVQSTNGVSSSDVVISTGKNKVTAVHLEISYDPKVLTNVDIKPGTFFNSPVVLSKKTDKVNGIITYDLAVSLGQSGVLGTGTVATLSFSTVTGTTVASTPINFLSTTAAVAIGYSQSVLKTSTGVLFTR